MVKFKDGSAAVNCTQIQNIEERFNIKSLPNLRKVANWGIIKAQPSKRIAIKISVIAFTFFLLLTPSVYSNFNCVIDTYSTEEVITSYIARDDNLIFTIDDRILAIERSTNSFKYYTKFSTDLEGTWGFDNFLTNTVATNSSIYEDESFCYFYSADNIIYFTNLFSIPKAIKIIDRSQIPNMKETEYKDGNIYYGDFFNGMIRTGNFDETSSTIYFVKQSAIVKVDLDKPDSILSSVKFPKELFLVGKNHTDMLYHPLDSAIWFKGYGSVLGRYNIYTEAIDVFDHTNLPLEQGFSINGYFMQPNANSTGGNVTFFVTVAEGFFKLLTFNSETRDWEIEEIGTPPDSSVVYDATKQPKVAKVFVMPSNSREILVCYSHIPATTMNTRNFTIYNRQTKEWRDFIIPINLFDTAYNHTYSEYFLVPLQVSWLKPDKTIGFLYRNNLIEYDPNVGIDDTDERIFMEIGFRNLYPNPTKRSVTAEIMCYVRDLSKLDIGLYNAIGQKILDLNNGYEYNEATATINMTIKLPEGYQDGIYYLNVRNGTERRTKGIVFGQ